MLRRIAFSILLISATATLAAQAKPNAPASVPVSKIIECVTASNCKNMTAARVSVWADYGPPMGMVFTEGGRKYELSLSGRVDSPRNLSIMTTAPSATRPEELITLDSTGKLQSASLATPPGVPAVAGRKTAAQQNAEWKQRKSFVAELGYPPGTIGADYRPFWQLRADRALAAIARVMTR